MSPETSDPVPAMALLEERRSTDGCTALLVAVRSRRIEAAEALLKAGAVATGSTRCGDPDGNGDPESAMEFALRLRDFDLVKLLGKYGVTSGDDAAP